MESRSPYRSESPAEIKKRLFGLRDFPVRSIDERNQLLGQSDDRIAAFERVTTSTMPAKLKREVKKGSVLEIVEKGIILEEILKKHPLVYIGSGIDVEYPLALGGRNIILVDPIFEDEDARNEVLKSIGLIINEWARVSQSNEIKFSFNFGEGKENVTVQLVAMPYKDGNKEGYILPENIGVVVMYASQGPDGVVAVTEDMVSKLVPGGIILEETRVHTFAKEKGEEVTELGS